MESTLFQHAGANAVALIETLGWDGRALVRLELHLARLGRSAQMLNYPFDDGAVRAALSALARGAPARLRLTLDARGAVQASTAPMPAAAALWRVGLAGPRLRSDDAFLRVKSTHRPAYDAARAALPSGLDEVVLQNERGEVADGSITTLFFDRGHGMRTPPLTSGALCGVLRAQLAVPEETLLVADLPKVRLWLGNSLRGLIPAVWCAPLTFT